MTDWIVKSPFPAKTFEDWRSAKVLPFYYGTRLFSYPTSIGNVYHTILVADHAPYPLRDQIPWPARNIAGLLQHHFEASNITPEPIPDDATKCSLNYEWDAWLWTHELDLRPWKEKW